jgi:CheY-like chemotaxis protein
MGNSQTLDRKVDILSVEDNPADQRLIQELLKKCKAKCELHFVRNGVEAMDYLLRRGAFAQVPRPDIVLLDLNMPKKDGRTVLKEVKENPELREIPVLILTTSSQRSDIKAAYALYANTFMTKPVDLANYESLIHAVDDFWFQHAQLPEKDELSDV